MNNHEAARMLFAVASLLQSEGANPFRVAAYRRAARRMLLLPQEGTVYLNAAGELPLPWLGKRLRRKLGELVANGRMQFYDNIVDALPPAKRQLLAVPGIGPVTAARLIGDLHLDGPRGVVKAAQDGRLRQVRGIGPRRQQRLAEAAARVLEEAA